jgi:hypothetical protein
MRDSIMLPMEVFYIYSGFWDPDEYYFNKDGYDKYGGFYGDNYKYFPGPNWDEENECYIDEINKEYNRDSDCYND